jgi:hypothetical protein
LLPGQNTWDFCRTHQILSNGSCFNADTQEVIEEQSYCWHFHDYGCKFHNPYGTLSTRNFLDASRLISNSTNVLILSDASDTVLNELQEITDDRNIFVLPTPHFHRAESTASGIAYFATIELASQCRAIVGHSGSAVTMVMARIMCLRHFGIFGKCPLFFDFGM